MRKLNKQSTQTMNKMVEMLEDGYIKIDNNTGSFMALSFEQIFENEKFKIYSVAHYYEQNCDLMADPEMCFILDKTSAEYFPSYFKMDGFLGREEESVLIEHGTIKGLRTKMQADHTTFANMWLKNIKYQQNL